MQSSYSTTITCSIVSSSTPKSLLTPNVPLDFNTLVAPPLLNSKSEIMEECHEI